VIAWDDEKFIDLHILVGKPGEHSPSGRPRHRWENSIKMDLKEVGWKVTDRTHLA
jgi:hypothetical protein